jgi:5-(carboxyamino)imidazole ribonucleotide synthase
MSEPGTTIELERPLPPGSRIGILGGGQLGRMLAMAAARLGFHCHIYSDIAAPPAAQVSERLTVGGYDDLEALAAFADNVDVITYEFENVPVTAAAHLSAHRPVSPPPRALAVAQDRLTEKDFISGLSIAVAPYSNIDGTEPLPASIDDLLPGIIKTRRLGYDGKGQIPVMTRGDLEAACRSLSGSPLILEQKIDFAFEVSILVARGADGTLAFYDIPRNEHRGGILRRSTVTDEIVTPDVAAQARVIGQRIAEALDYVGVLAVELFVEAEGKIPSLRVNEIAPRVHNSGHWTMDACATDQFENHIRAICRWPLGPTTRRQDIEMVNLIGDDVSRWPEIASDGEAKLHLYGKDEAREGRKMGHVNRVIPRAGSA